MTVPKKFPDASVDAVQLNARLDAQALVLDKLVDALKAASNGSFDVAVLKREIREAVDSAGGDGPA